jgi:hypothetical protein
MPVLGIDQHGSVEPVTKEQCDFDVQSVIGDRSAPTLDGALHPVFHRVGMKMLFVCGGLEARPRPQEHPKRFA